jgi:hypothetical protein
MSSPFTTPLPAYLFYQEGISQGAVLAFFGGYAPNKGEPVGGWIPFGAIEPGGITDSDKPTFSEIQIAQLVNPIAAYHTKRAASFKMTLSHVKPEIINMVRGYRPASLVTTLPTPSAFGTQVQGMGEPADIGNGGDIVLGAGDEPRFEADSYQIVFLYPSPNFTKANTPKAKWGYVRYWNAYAKDPGDIKRDKDKHSTVSVSINALTDFSVVGSASRVGETYGFLPKVGF